MSRRSIVHKLEWNCCKHTEFYSFPSALNLFFMWSISPLFSQISAGYELDSEKSVKCRQWWKRQRAWERCSIAKPAVNISIAQNPQTNQWSVFCQITCNADQYICNTSALKIKLKLRLHWLYISARGKKCGFPVHTFPFSVSFQSTYWMAHISFLFFCGLNCFNTH